MCVLHRTRRVTGVLGAYANCLTKSLPLFSHTVILKYVRSIWSRYSTFAMRSRTKHTVKVGKTNMYGTVSLCLSDWSRLSKYASDVRNDLKKWLRNFFYFPSHSTAWVVYIYIYIYRADEIMLATCVRVYLRQMRSRPDIHFVSCLLPLPLSFFVR